jgi:hypothetical protein
MARRGLVFLLVAGLSVLPAGGALFPVAAGAVVPACGSVLLAGTSWLNGGGVDVLSNGPNQGTGVSCNGGTQYQCTELINRLYQTKGWITSTWHGNGGRSSVSARDSMYDEAPAGLTKDANGSISSVSPGDVVSINEYDHGTFLEDGHVLIVNTASTVTSGSVSLVSQNGGSTTSAATSRTANLNGGTLTLASSGSFSYEVIGVVHAPNGTPPTDGSFVSNRGHVYRIAGGAPLGISDCGPLGGCPGLTAVDDQTLASLAPVPADGTFLEEAGAGIYRVAGGAPLALSDCTPFGNGCDHRVAVNQSTIVNLDHLRAAPSVGTVLQGSPSNTYWTSKGSCRWVGRLGGATPVVVNDASLSSLHACALADFDADGSTDIGVFRPSVGGWYIQGQSTTFLGLSGDTPVPGDYNGDGTADIAVYRPSVGGWYVNGQAPVFFGLPGDVPVPGDYNGDGTTDIAIYRPSVGGWYIRNQATVFYGLSTDIPVPGDYNGDGTTDPAVYRPSVGGWYINGQTTIFHGVNTDTPVPGDYNGDGSTDPAVYRNGAWLIRNQSTVFLGLASDTPVPGDYNADGSTDAAIFRPSVGGWYINGQSPVFYGLPGDIPTPERPDQ